ncbi:MAG: regulatory protein RecX [Candidatus Omnitrophica bacterium]|nr:regulatory protein RecX [Candidatus Omnitrophota bacterium]
MNEEEFKKAFAYALRFVNYRPRTIREFRDKLKEKGFQDGIILKLQSEFIKKGLLDDAKFSKLWVENRMSSNPKAIPVLRHELKEKGVEDNIIDEALKVLEDISEYDFVKGLAEARRPSLAGLGKETLRRRLYAYLKRRGFSDDIILKVITEEF